jgi:hypothetical protein
VFTGVKTSTELLADRDLREARHPVVPVLGHAVEKLQAQAPCLNGLRNFGAVAL